MTDKEVENIVLKPSAYYNQFFIELAKEEKIKLTVEDIEKIQCSQLDIQDLELLKTFAINEHFDFAGLCLFVRNVMDFTGVSCAKAYESYITCKDMINDYYSGKSK